MVSMLILGDNTRNTGSVQRQCYANYKDYSRVLVVFQD